MSNETKGPDTSPYIVQMYYQKCPKCDGQGIVSKPPHIPGDVHQWSRGTQTSWVCNVCNGLKIIPVVQYHELHLRIEQLEAEKSIPTYTKEDILQPAQENPYPEDVFIEPTKEQWKELHEYMVLKGMSADKFAGAWGRRVWNNCIERILENLESQQSS